MTTLRLGQTGDAEREPLPVKEGDVLVGRYVVERVIGFGGMGVVIAVRHQELGELYAMKLLMPSAMKNAEAVDRFLREARAAARLRSEHVARVSDVGKLDSGLPFMVMEYLEGKDLDVLLENGTVPTHLAAQYVLQACEAIAEAHDAGIVHRDIKPANLFLAKRPNDATTIKVLDFGISKIDDPNKGAGSMTRTTAVLGSPYYMSPEQMRSSKTVDRRTDVWSLGVVLYQLATGRVPFPGDTITEVCAKVLNDEPPPIHEINPQVGEVYTAIVDKCLNKDPAQRFADARELARVLAPIAGFGSTTDPAIVALLKNTRAAIIAPGTTAGGSEPAPRSDVAASAHTVADFGAGAKKSRSVPLAAVGVIAVVAVGVGVYLAQHFALPGTPDVAEEKTTATAATHDAPATPARGRTTEPPTQGDPTPAPTATQSAAVDDVAPVESASAAPVVEPAPSTTPSSTTPSSTTPTAARPAVTGARGTAKPPTTAAPKTSATATAVATGAPAEAPTTGATGAPTAAPTAAPSTSARGHGLM